MTKKNAVWRQAGYAVVTGGPDCFIGWYAVFIDLQDAEAYAMTLPPGLRPRVVKVLTKAMSFDFDEDDE